MTGQKRKHSFLEILISTVIGYFVALATQIAVFPHFGILVSHGQHLVISLIFTVVSVARGYLIRRFFNWLYFKEILQ